MAWIVATEPGTRIAFRAGRIRAEREGMLVGSVPLESVDACVLGYGVEPSRGALDALAGRGAPTILLDRNGGRAGCVLPFVRRDAGLRLAQAAAVLDPRIRLEYARDAVHRKLTEERARLHAWRKLDGAKRGPEVQLHDRLLEATRRARDLNELRGVEGAGAKAYFAALGARAPEGWWRGRRTRRPPEDRFNALLSLGYTVLAHRVEARAIAEGLDPDLGFLHESHRGHPALALDLLEAFRAPIVDAWALGFARSLGKTSEAAFDDDYRLVPSALRVGLRRLGAAVEARESEIASQVREWAGRLRFRMSRPEAGAAYEGSHEKSEADSAPPRSDPVRPVPFGARTGNHASSSAGGGEGRKGCPIG